MKIVNIIGGLGNQMFQYAFGKELELRNGEPVQYNVLWYNHYNRHNGFELERLFNCKISYADIKNVKKISTPPNSIINRLRRKYATKSTHYIDRYFTYNETVFAITGDIFYDGFWQSEKYFLNVIADILKDFTFKLAVDKKNEDLLAQTANLNIASLHVRRGDYLKSENLNVCTIDYYQNALTKLRELTAQNPLSLFFIFSDDMDWCKKNLNLGKDAVFINWNTGENSWQDMYLMSRCSHNIIANSSFSWWAAYLNKNPQKIVIAPHIWNMRQLRTTDNYYHYDYSSVVPATWIRVPFTPGNTKIL